MALIKPTILQILPALKAGGVERGTVDIAAAQIKAGYRALVVSNGGPMVAELTASGADHITMPVHSKKPWVMLANITRLEEICRAEQVALIHARSRAPAWSALAAARRCEIPFMTTYHGTYNAGNRVKSFYNSVMARGVKVIAISEFIRGHVAAHYPWAADRLVTIPRGIDFTRFDPTAISAERKAALLADWQIPTGQPLIMLPGRFARWKGHLWLIEALSQLKDQAWHCLLLGDAQGNPGYREDIQAALTRHGLVDRVSCRDHCRDMATAYAVSDVVVSASTDPEAFGRVAVEAQAMGVPVVASAHGGSLETVRDSLTGFLVPVQHGPELAAALNRALAVRGEARQAWAIRARAHVNPRYSLGKMAEDTLAVYQSLLRG